MINLNVIQGNTVLTLVEIVGTHIGIIRQYYRAETGT